MSLQDIPTLVTGIAEALRQRLGAMTPGERLPTVRELMAAHGASQFSVQTALGRLKSEGLIESHVGRGTFVAGRAAGPARPRELLVLSHEQQSERADEMARSIHRAFLKRDWRSAVLTYCDSDQAQHIVGGGSRFDACVVQPRGGTLPLSLLATLRARSQTVVVEGYSVAGVDVDTIAIDWPAAVSTALRRLVEQGHRQVAFVYQAFPARSFVEAGAQFRRLHGWAGLSSAADPVIALPAGPEEAAFAALGRVLAKEARRPRAPFTAYIVYPRPFHGERLLRAFEGAGLAVPDDSSVVTLGYTDLPVEHAGRLDTVGQSTQTITEAIAAAIERRWQAPDAPYGVTYLEPDLVARGSSAAPRLPARKRA